MKKVAAPPVLAQILMNLLAPKGLRENLLGDMQEAYYHAETASRRAAANWYWRQTLLSLPSFISQRIKTERNKKRLVAALFVVVAFALINAWDIYIARGSSQTLAAQGYAPPLFYIRALYFLVQMLGVAAVGAVITAAAVRMGSAPRIDANKYILSVIAMLVASAAHTYLTAEGPYPVTYLLLRVGLAIPALYFGSGITKKFLRATRQ